VSVPFEAHHHWFCTNEFPEIKYLRTYHFAFNSLLGMIYKFMWQHHCNLPLQVLFEQQGDESQKLILNGMNELRRLNSIHLPGLEILDPEFIPGKNNAPLQAADLLAWLVRRDANNVANSIDRNWAAESLMLGEILSVKNTVKVWSDAGLEKVASEVAHLLTASTST
jgi:hypothetical protein